jgi:NADH-quinone oxidoreductase subunit N
VTTDLGIFDWLLPASILVVAAMAIFLGSSLWESRRIWFATTVIAFVVAAGVMLRQDTSLLQRAAAIDNATGGSLFTDYFGYTLCWVALSVGFAFVLVASRTGSETLCGEYLGALTLATAGLMLASTANNLVMLFLAFELVTIPTYVLLFLGRRDLASAEATAKYFFLSILSSAILLYGFSFLYGAAGSTSLAEIRTHLAAADNKSPVLSALTLVLVLAGLGFKVAAVPFHFYAPDVYQGTTNVNAGFLAVIPKIAGIVGLIRVITVAAPPTVQFAWQVTLVVSLLTMTVGNVSALWQTNLRRLMAYSSIAHAGYMLMGLSVGLASDEVRPLAYDGLTAMLFYLLVYAVASLGTFAAWAHLSSSQRELNWLNDLAGLGRERPWVGGAIAVFMFSLSGIPPLAGFWGKLGLLASALGLAGSSRHTLMSQWFIALAVVGALNAAIAAAYYLRIVGVMYFRSSTGIARDVGSSSARWVSLACALAVLLIGFAPRPLLEQSRHAIASTRPPAPSILMVADSSPDAWADGTGPVSPTTEFDTRSEAQDIAAN